MASCRVNTETIASICDDTGNLVDEGSLSRLAAFTVSDGNPPFSCQAYPVFNTAFSTCVIGAEVGSTYPDTFSSFLTAALYTVYHLEPEARETTPANDAPGQISLDNVRRGVRGALRRRSENGGVALPARSVGMAGAIRDQVRPLAASLQSVLNSVEQCQTRSGWRNPRLQE